MRMRYLSYLACLLSATGLVGLPRPAGANPCISPDPADTVLFSQGFPTTATEVTRWEGLVCSVGNQGLALGLTAFRKSPSAPFIQIFHDARVSEVFVHYHNGTQFFDIRDFSTGLMTLGAECAGTLILADRACLEVRDRGLAYKTDFNARRGEELVLWGVTRSANYKYLMEWTLRDDGVVVGRVGATGENLVGKHDVPHIHTITWRLDIDLNGFEGDSVREVTHIESPLNKTARDSVALITTEGGRVWSASGFRYWRINDATLTNAQGHSTGLRLIPVRSGMSRHDRAYTRKDFWVTRHTGSKTTQMFAGALPSYVANQQSVVAQDVVVWYTGAIHHVPRDEDDFGATQVMSESFRLEPQNLHDQSPFPE
ncbi:MAG: copper amine oxidase [Chromatiales bacterium]